MEKMNFQFSFPHVFFMCVCKGQTVERIKFDGYKPLGETRCVFKNIIMISLSFYASIKQCLISRSYSGVSQEDFWCQPRQGGDIQPYKQPPPALKK